VKRLSGKGGRNQTPFFKQSREKNGNNNGNE